MSQTQVFKYLLNYTADSKVLFWISLCDQKGLPRTNQFRAPCEGQKILTIVLHVFSIKVAYGTFCSL